MYKRDIPTLGEIQEAFNAGSSAEKTAFQSSVSGDVTTIYVSGAFDGSTDDTAAWRSAMSAAAAAGRARVVGKPGVSVVTGNLLSLVPDNATLRVEVCGAGSNYYGVTEIKCTTPNATVFDVRQAGLSFSNLAISGDGGAYGAGATVTGINGVGRSNGTSYDLDMLIENCVFSRVAYGVKQRGKNLLVEGSTLFSNCLFGIDVGAMPSVDETRGLDVGGSVRFHSCGGQSVAAVAINIAPAANFLDAKISGYFDDCNKAITGYAAPLLIHDANVVRCWGGIELDSTGRTMTEWGKSSLNINGLTITNITDSGPKAGLSIFNSVGAWGVISGVNIHNTSSHCMSIDSASGVLTEVRLSGVNLMEPGDGSSDGLRIGTNVIGLTIEDISVAKKSSATTGYGINQVGARSGSYNTDTANIIGQGIRVTGFSAANRIRLQSLLEHGVDWPIINDSAIQVSTFVGSFTWRALTHRRVFILSGTQTANFNITLAADNAYDGMRMTLWKTGPDGFTMSVFDNTSSLIATTTGGRLDFVFSGSAGGKWVRA